MKNKTPQLENGFIQIATGKKENDVLMALIKTPLSSGELKCILLIIRKTWGFKKKEDWISLTQFANYTSRSISQICVILKSLLKKNIVLKKTLVGKCSLYQFNKDFNQWKILLKKTRVLKKTIITTQENHNQLLKKTRDTKETITKETITTTNTLVEKITLWAYKSARVNPSCNVGAFKRSVLLAIKRVGERPVYKAFERESNAIQFLVNIKNL